MKEQTNNRLGQFVTDSELGQCPNSADPAKSISIEKNEIKKINLDTIINKEGIIIRWPKKKEEKLAVLDYLITKFEAGVQYKELQVNMILKKWHSFGDHALLRRELYDNFYMDRNPATGTYWVEDNKRNN